MEMSEVARGKERGSELQEVMRIVNEEEVRLWVGGWLGLVVEALRSITKKTAQFSRREFVFYIYKKKTCR